MTLDAPSARPLLGTTRLLGVIGWPVRHSFSPPMHNAALAALGLDWAYVPFPVRPEDLPAAFAGLRAAGVVGFNATIPHKEALAGLVDELTEEAELTGTVNTVHFLDETGREGAARRAVGDSTDGPGFVAGLEAAGCEVAGRRVLLLGAGGSARAVAVSLARRGADLIVANRTHERAESLAGLVNGRIRPGAARLAAPGEVAEAVAEVDLVVNTTSVGMARQDDPAAVERLPLEPAALDRLRPGAWVVDIVYNPAETRLLREAAARGARVQNGVEMLVGQGALALARWTELEPPTALMRSVLTAELRRRSGPR